MANTSSPGRSGGHKSFSIIMISTMIKLLLGLSQISLPGRPRGHGDLFHSPITNYFMLFRPISKATQNKPIILFLNGLHHSLNTMLLSLNKIVSCLGCNVLL